MNVSATSTPRRKRALWVRVLRVLVVVYVAWCALLYFSQDSMVFPATFAGQGGTVLAGAQVMEMPIDGVGTVRAWYMPAPDASADTPAPLVVFFHGNAELIDDQASMASAYHARGWSVLLPEYRGYGHSDGKPSQASIVADAAAFYDQIVQRSDVDASRIVFHGRSVGGAIAAQVAARRTPAALIMESTPANVAAMAWGFGVPPIFVKHSFRTDRVMRELDVPVLLFHGTADTIIPVDNARQLHQLASDARLIEFDCDHNSLPGARFRDAYWQAIDEHLAGLAGQADQSDGL